MKALAPKLFPYYQFHQEAITYVLRMMNKPMLKNRLRLRNASRKHPSRERRISGV